MKSLSPSLSLSFSLSLSLPLSLFLSLSFSLPVAKPSRTAVLPAFSRSGGDGGGFHAAAGTLAIRLSNFQHSDISGDAANDDYHGGVRRRRGQSIDGGDRPDSRSPLDGLRRCRCRRRRRRRSLGTPGNESVSVADRV